jgi:hypothetical protein
MILEKMRCKSIFLILACFICTTSSFGQINKNYTVHLSLDKSIIDEMPYIEAIESRAKSYNRKSKVAYNNGKIVIHSRKAITDVFAKQLYTSVGKLRVQKAFYAYSIINTFKEIEKIIQDTVDFQLIKNESSDSNIGFLLSNYLTLNLDVNGEMLLPPIIGYVKSKDTAIISSIVIAFSSKFNDSIHFLYGMSQNIMGIECYPLYAFIDSGLTITEQMISSASILRTSHDNPNYLVGIELSICYHTTWQELTRNSVNEFLAIVVDDQVYAAPRVMSEITNGKLSLLSSSLAESKILAAILDNPLPSNQLYLNRIEN